MQQDYDAVNNLRDFGQARRQSRSGAVEAVIYVQPVCGDSSVVDLSCSQALSNCYPYCMGVVKGGLGAQNISMFNAETWNNNVLLPDVDCGIRRDVGTCASASAVEQAILDLGAEAGIRQARCSFSSSRLCTPNAAPGIVNSLISLEALDGDENSTIHAVKQHKNIWAAVRLATGNNPQPFVVAGDVMLSLTSLTTDEESEHKEQYVVVSRLYDIGRSSLQLSAERLTSVSNAHAVRVETCATQSAFACVATAMSEGHVVLPPSYALVGTSGPLTSSINVPATASQWAIHWAVNPELSIYYAYFQFCRNTSQFTYEVHSSWGRARVWTLHTMRSVDFELEGTPRTEETKSRVSYMLIPDFFEPGQDLAGRTACNAIVGLRIVGVEYLNQQNILVTVLAGKPEDYDPELGDIVSGKTRHYRYYFLHPSRHDCVEPREGTAQKDFSCWRTAAEGMWPDDNLLYGGSWAGFSDGLCPASRPVPAFGKLLVMPWVATVNIIEIVLDAVCTLTAAITVNPSYPGEANNGFNEYRL